MAGGGGVTDWFDRISEPQRRWKVFESSKYLTKSIVHEYANLQFLRAVII